MLKLNPALDLAPYAEDYRRRGMVQVADLFDPASAEALLGLLARGVPWRLNFLEGEKAMSYAPEGVDAIGREAFSAKINGVQERARRGDGYLFAGYPMSQAREQNWDAGHPIHQVNDFLNGDAFLNLGRTVIGQPDLNRAEAFATLYAPGHFLTRHIDHGVNNERRAAYVISLCRDWKPDWGGLLVFFDDRNDIAGGFTPRFNVVTIFDVKHPHAVTQVANFAGGGRYSISGWFRNDPR